MINAAIQKARKISRSEALKKVVKVKESQRPVFVIAFDPRLPSISQIVSRHWRTMRQDPYLAQVFPQPPLVAYKRPANLRDKLIRAKVPELPPPRIKRIVNGMKKCSDCPICPFVKTGQIVKSAQSDFKIEIQQSVNCQTRNLIYMINCRKCKNQYIGESSRTLQSRFSEHLGYVRSKNLSKATGEHFSTKGHQQSDMEVTIVEKLFNNSDQFRKQREKMYIQKFNTKYKGMNQKT